MVRRDVGVFIDWGNFVLAWRHFVMPCLDRYTELEQIAFAFQHEGEYTFGNGTEILVTELLTLRWLRTEESSPGTDQVWSSKKEVPVNQEVFLFGAA